jgi:hypothetical protein
MLLFHPIRVMPVGNTNRDVLRRDFEPFQCICVFLSAAGLLSMTAALCSGAFRGKEHTLAVLTVAAHKPDSYTMIGLESPSVAESFT